MTYQKRDFRQELTDGIIEALEKGVPPWRQGWEGVSLRMPFNPTTGKTYRGGNVLGLMLTAMKKGYGDPRWLTYKQAEANGWQVYRGEKGTQVEFWKAVDSDNEEEHFGIFDDNSGKDKDKDKTRFIHRVYTVFNASQIEGIPDNEPTVKHEWEAIQSAESIMKNSRAAIVHANQGGAFYRTGTDTILTKEIKRRMACEDFWRKARKQVPRIAELCAGSADAALRQKDRKTTLFYLLREYTFHAAENRVSDSR
jgi:antirestriction protein ArdC